MNNFPSQENFLWKFLFYAFAEKLEFPVFFCDGKFPLTSRVIWMNDYAVNFFSFSKDVSTQQIFLNNLIDISSYEGAITDGTKISSVTVVKKKYYNIVATVSFYGDYHIVEIQIDTNSDLKIFYQISDAINFYPLGKIVWNYISGQVVKYNNGLATLLEDVTHPTYISSFLVEPEVAVLQAKVVSPRQNNKPLYHKCIISSPKQSMICVGRFWKSGPYMYGDIVVAESGILSVRGLIKACSIIPGIFALIQYDVDANQYVFNYVNTRFVHSFLKSSMKEVKSQLPAVFFAEFGDEKIIPFLDSIINETDNYQSRISTQFVIKNKPIKFALEVTKVVITDQIIFVLSLVENSSQSDGKSFIKTIQKLASSIQPESQKILIKIIGFLIIFLLGYIVFGVELKPLILDIIKIIFN